MLWATLSDFIHHNESLPCSVNGCRNHRWKKSKYCHNHNNRAAATGDPNTIPTIKYRFYKREIELVRELLIQSIGKHPGIDLVITYINRQKQRATLGHEIKNARLWAGLDLYAASAVDIIARAGAIYLLWVNESTLLKSVKHLRYMVGRSIMGLTNQTRLGIVSSAPYPFRSLGTELDDEFAPFFISLAKGVKEMLEAKEDRRKMLSEKFNAIDKLSADRRQE